MENFDVPHDDDSNNSSSEEEETKSQDYADPNFVVAQPKLKKNESKEE